MNVLDYINSSLKTLDLYKTQSKILKQQIQDNNSKTMLLAISAAEEILAYKPNPNQGASVHPPLVQLNCLRLIKEGVDTGNQDFLRQFMNSKIPQLIENNYGAFEANSQFDDRGATIFSSSPDGHLKMVGNSMLRLVLEICYYWGRQYSIFDGRKSPIRVSYENLLLKNVKFPEKVHYFKNSEFPNPNAGYIQDLQQLKQQQLQNQVQNLNTQNQKSSQDEEDEAINQINDDIDDAEKHYNKILDCFEVAQEAQLDRLVLSESLLGVNNFQKVLSMKNQNLLKSNVIKDQEQKENLTLDIQDMKEDIDKVLTHINQYTQKKITFQQLKNLLFNDGKQGPDNGNGIDNKSTSRSQNVPDIQHPRNSSRRNSSANKVQNLQNNNNNQFSNNKNQNSYRNQNAQNNNDVEDLEVEDIDDFSYEPTKVTAFRAQAVQEEKPPQQKQQPQQSTSSVQSLTSASPVKKLEPLKSTNTYSKPISQQSPKPLKSQNPSQQNTVRELNQSNKIQSQNSTNNNYQKQQQQQYQQQQYSQPNNNTQNISNYNSNNSVPKEDYQQTLKNLQKQQEAEQEKYQQQIEMEKTKLESKQAKLLQEQQMMSQEQINKLKQDMIDKENDLQHKIFQLNKEKLEEKHQKDLLQEKIQNLLDRINEKEQEINKLQKQLNEFKSEKDQMQQSVLQANNKHQELDTKSKDFQIQISQKEIEIEKLKSQNAILQNKLDTFQNTKDNVIQKDSLELQKLSSQYMVLEKQVQEKEEKIANAQISIHRLSQENQELELELKSHRNKKDFVEANQQIIQQYKEQSLKDTQKIIEVENQNSLLLTQLEDLKKKLNTEQQQKKKSILKNKAQEIFIDKNNTSNIHNEDEQDYSEEKLNQFEEKEQEKYQTLFKKAKSLEKENTQQSKILQNLQTKLMDQEEITANAERILSEKQQQVLSLEEELNKKNLKMKKQKKQLEELQIQNMLNMQKTQDLLFEKLQTNPQEPQSASSKNTRGVIRSQLINNNLSSLGKITNPMSLTTNSKKFVNIEQNETLNTEDVDEFEQPEDNQNQENKTTNNILLNKNEPISPQAPNVQLSSYSKLLYQKNNSMVNPPSETPIKMKPRRNSLRTKKSYSMHNTIEHSDKPNYDNQLIQKLQQTQSQIKSSGLYSNNQGNSSDSNQFSQPIQISQNGVQSRGNPYKQNQQQQQQNISSMSKTVGVNPYNPMTNNNQMFKKMQSTYNNFMQNASPGGQRQNAFNTSRNNQVQKKKSYSVDIRQNQSAMQSARPAFNNNFGYTNSRGQNTISNMNNYSEFMQTQDINNPFQNRSFSNTKQNSDNKIKFNKDQYVQQQLQQSDKDTVMFNSKHFEQFLIYDIENFINFRKACLLDQGIIFKNKYISISSQSQITEFQGQRFLKLIITVKNQSLTFINRCDIEYKKNKDIQLFTKPQTIQQAIPVSQSLSQELILDLNFIPNDPLTMKIHLDLQDKSQKNYNISIPATLNKLMTNNSISQTDFQQKWEENKQAIIKTQNYLMDPNIAQSHKQIQQYFQNLVELNPFNKQEYLEGRGEYIFGGSFSLLLKPGIQYLIKIVLLPGNSINIQLASTNRILNDEDRNILSFLLQSFYFLIKQ